MPATDHAKSLATTAAHAAAEKLATTIVALDVSGQLPLTDVFLIVAAPSERQVAAIVDEVEEKVRLAGTRVKRMEGAREGRWVLMDFGDVVVHVQHEDERDFYDLERLWRDCPQLDVGVVGTDQGTLTRPGASD